MTTLLSVSITTSSSGVSPIFQVRNPREVPRNLALQASFNVATGSSLGTGLEAWVQTSLDGRTTFFDVATFFTTAVTTGLAQVAANLSAATPVTTQYTPTNASLTTGTVKDGFLGSHYQVQWKALGTYGAGTTLKIDAAGLELIASGS